MKLKIVLIIFGLAFIAIAVTHTAETEHNKGDYIAGCVEAKQQAIKSDMRMQGVIIKECEQNWKNYQERNRWRLNKLLGTSASFAIIRQHLQAAPVGTVS